MADKGLGLHDLLFTKNTANGFRGFRSFGKPILRPFRVDFDERGVRNGVVLSNNFQESSVARLALLDDHDPVIGTLFRPDTGQTHCYQTVSLLTNRKTLRL